MNTELRVKLASFEGPLDLLLYLIQKDEIDIKNIRIAEITEQYLRTLDLMREYNLDTAGDFLLMAASLIYIKSGALLPNQNLENQDALEITTQEELIRRLQERKRYLDMAQDFKLMPMLGADFFKRPLPEEREKREQLLKEMNLTDLTLAFQQMLMRTRRPVAIVKKDRMSIAQAAEKIANRLAAQEVTEFQSLFSPEADRSEIVATFLAILELGRLGKLRVLQHIVYGSIYLVPREMLNQDIVNKLFEKGDAYAYARQPAASLN